MIKGRISVRSVLAFCVAMCVGGWAFGKPPCSGDELIAIVREGHESLLPDVFYVDTVVPEWKLQKDAEHISIEELLHQLAEQREQVDHARGLMLDPCIGELLAAKGTEVLIAEENRTLYPLSFMQRLAMVMWVDAGRRWREQDLDGAADSLAAIGGVMRVGAGVGGDSGRTLTARTTLREGMRMISGFLDGAGESMNGQRRAGGILRAIEQLDGKDPARGWARFRESWRHEAEMMRGLLSIGEVGEKTKYTLSTAEATTTGYTAVDTDDTLKEYIEAQRQAAERLEKLTAKEAIRALDRAMAVAQRVDDGAAAGRFDEASRIAREATEKDELGLADWLMGKTWISNDGRANLVERLEALKQRLRGMISVAPK